jgi:hypothetical protein
MLRRIVPVLVVFLGARAAYADERAACIAAADRGQDLRDHRKLVSAREQFVACARDACPSAVRKDCIQWQADVESRLPTVVFVAHDDAGNELANVRVLVDGEPVTQKLDGASLNVDPGEHAVVFEQPPRKSASVRIIVHEGEKNRQVKAVLATDHAQPLPAPPPPATKPAPETSSSGSFAPAIAVGAGGVILLGGALALGFSARSDVSHLRDTCAGHCASSDVDAARRKLVFADVGIGLGVVALGIATYLALARSSHSEAVASAARAR